MTSNPSPSRWLSIVLRAVVVLLFLWMARAYLPAVLLGGALAVVLDPVQRRLERRMRRGAAAFLLTLAVLIAAVVPLAILAFRAAIALQTFLTEQWATTAAQLRTYLGDTGPLASLGFDGEDISTAADSIVRNLAGGLARLAANAVGAVPGQIISLFLLCASVYYLLADRERVVRWLRQALPFSELDTGELMRTVRETIKGVILGVFATAFVQGGLTALALLVLGVPAAFALGVIAGLLSIVPLLGTTPVTVGAVIYLATVGRTEAALVMAVAAVVIGVSDNLVRPYLMHVATPHQHPLLILLGVFGGVAAFGAAGVFLGPILAALAAWAVITARQAG